MQGPAIAIVALQSFGLALTLLLLATTWIGKVHRHAVLIVFWLLVLAAEVNSIVPHILALADGFHNTASCISQAIASQFLWTTVSVFVFSFILELARIVYNAANAEVKASISPAGHAYIAATLCVLPFFLAGPTLDIAIFTAPWTVDLLPIPDVCLLDNAALRITQAITLSIVFGASLVVAAWTGSLVLRIHTQASQTCEADLDINFLIRLTVLAVISSAGAGLTIAFNLVRVQQQVAFVFDIYIVIIPILASFVFVGSDTIQVWRRWLHLQGKRRANPVSMMTIGGTCTPSKSSKKSLAKRVSIASSEFVSRSSEMPAGWLGRPFGQDERLSAMVWRDSRRSSVAASSMFGSPMFTLQSSASSKDFEIRSIRVAGKPDLDGDEHVQEVVDLTRLKENVESPRRRHQASSSKDSLVIPRNFMNLTPNPIGSSTYSASEYSRWSSNPTGTHLETQPSPPTSPKAALRDMQKARSTPSPKHSPRLVSFKPEVGQHTSIASGMATIKPLRLQERSHGLSIYDLYARDRESRAAQPAKPYGWI